MSARLVVFLVALALCLTGCATIVVGTPVSGAAAAARPMSAARELGDFSTIDPCSIVDTEGLPTDLAAQSEPEQSLDYCALHVTSGGGAAEAEVGALIFQGPDAGTPESLPSGLWLYPGTVEQGSCSAYLKFHEGIEMTSTVYSTDGTGSSALCRSADELARNVSGVLARGPVTHRSFPAKSLGALNPCTFLDQATLAAAGVDTYPTRYPAHHECDWTSSDGNLAVSLTFIVGLPPVAQQNVSTAAQIAGRNSVLYSSTNSGAADCWIDTGGMPFSAGGPNLVEIAEIYVTDQNQTTDQACSVGTTLATAAWPALPSAS